MHSNIDSKRWIVCLFYSASAVVLFATIVRGQACGSVGTTGSELVANSDHRFYLNTRHPAQCNGTVRHFQFCYYQSSYRPGRHVDSYSFTFAIYRQTEPGSYRVESAAFTPVVSVMTVQTSASFACQNYQVQGEIQIRTGDMLGACIYDPPETPQYGVRDQLDVVGLNAPNNYVEVTGNQGCGDSVVPESVRGLSVIGSVLHISADIIPPEQPTTQPIETTTHPITTNESITTLPTTEQTTSPMATTEGVTAPPPMAMSTIEITTDEMDTTRASTLVFSTGEVTTGQTLNGGGSGIVTAIVVVALTIVISLIIGLIMFFAILSLRQNGPHRKKSTLKPSVHKGKELRQGTIESGNNNHIQDPSVNAGAPSRGQEQSDSLQYNEVYLCFKGNEGKDIRVPNPCSNKELQSSIEAYLGFQGHPSMKNGAQSREQEHSDSLQYNETYLHFKGKEGKDIRPRMPDTSSNMEMQSSSGFEYNEAYLGFHAREEITLNCNDAYQIEAGGTKTTPATDQNAHYTLPFKSEVGAGTMKGEIGMMTRNEAYSISKLSDEGEVPRNNETSTEHQYDYID